MTTRAEIEAAAREWLGTPYHHHGRVKGVGVDCGWLLIRVYADTGAVEDFDPGFYSNDWHMHRSAEQYLGHVQKYADEITADEALPGDVVVMRFGRTYSHGGILIGEGMLIHSYIGRGCEIAELSEFKDRPMKFYRVRGLQ